MSPGRKAPHLGTRTPRLIELKLGSWEVSGLQIAKLKSPPTPAHIYPTYLPSEKQLVSIV